MFGHLVPPLSCVPLEPEPERGTAVAQDQWPDRESDRVIGRAPSNYRSTVISTAAMASSGASTVSGDLSVTAAVTSVTARANTTSEGRQKTQPPSPPLAALPESVEFGVPLRRPARPLQRATKLWSLRGVTAQVQMALAASSQELQQHQMLQSYVGGGGGGFDFDDSEDDASPGPRATRVKPSGRPAVTYWPPQSWSLLEPQQDEEDTPGSRGARQGRAVAASAAKPRRRRRPRQDEVQVGFTDKNRDVAVTDGHDIKMSLRRCRQVEASVVDIRATWWTYLSEAETATKRRQLRYACGLFDKVSPTGTAPTSLVPLGGKRPPCIFSQICSS